LKQFPTENYFGEAVDAGAVASPALFLAFLLLWLLLCFLMEVAVSLLAGVWLLLADGVWFSGLPPPAAWAKLKALPRASAQTIANDFFIRSP
jgi:hypothetical protein